MNITRALQIRYNKRVHDEQARTYESAHVEIYNEIEQRRIRTLLEEHIATLRRERNEIHAFDFGSGTGNLTGHLLDLGLRVVAADVSPESLVALETRLRGRGDLTTAVLNGTDLEGFRDGQFDVVATYSVLHHVPDYLAIVREFARVVRPGGLIVIDHECCPEYWAGNPTYREYLAAYHARHAPTRAQLWLGRARRSLSLSQWRRFLAQKFLGINAEGDIHVFPHDHIEWDRIRAALSSCEVVTETDYLVCRERVEPPPLHEAYRDRCHDMRVGVYRRRVGGI